MTRRISRDLSARRRLEARKQQLGLLPQFNMPADTRRDGQTRRAKNDVIFIIICGGWVLMCHHLCADPPNLTPLEAKH
jgi:hypothetical protein